MNYLIVDDEPIAHRIIEGYCTDISYLQKAGNAYNAFEASGIVTEKSVDLVFLDINMPKLSGFDWLKTLPSPPLVIVTTAFREHALDGFDLDVVDYLLKPFSLSRFLKAVNKAHDLCGVIDQHPVAPLITTPRESFFVKGDKKHLQIHLADIIFVEAYGNYTKIHLADERVLSHESISAMSARLSGHGFMRVHKSFVVAVNKIKEVRGNQLYLREHTVPVGQTYRSKVSELLNKS